MKKKEKEKKSSIQTDRVLVGFISIYLILSMGTGDFFSAGMLMFASIVCTLGLGLIVWIPLSWLTGFIVLYLINFLRSQSFSSTTKNIPTDNTEGAVIAKTISNDVLAIAQYIQKSRGRGASDSQITNRLKWTGWTEQDIGLAFSYLNNIPKEA